MIRPQEFQSLELSRTEIPIIGKIGENVYHGGVNIISLKALCYLLPLSLSAWICPAGAAPGPVTWLETNAVTVRLRNASVPLVAVFEDRAVGRLTNVTVTYFLPDTVEEATETAGVRTVTQSSADLIGSGATRTHAVLLRARTNGTATARIEVQGFRSDGSLSVASQLRRIVAAGTDLGVWFNQSGHDNRLLFSIWNNGPHPAENVRCRLKIECRDVTKPAILSTSLDTGRIVSISDVTVPYDNHGSTIPVSHITLDVVIPVLPGDTTATGSLVMMLTNGLPVHAGLLASINGEENGVPISETPIEGNSNRAYRFEPEHFADAPYVVIGSNGIVLFRSNSRGEARTISAANRDAIPAMADFDGDGELDASLFDPKNAEWTIDPDSGTGIVKRRWGVRNSLPVPGDYNGDGRAELAVYDPGTGQWLIDQPGAGRRIDWGSRFAVPVPADYDGDGRTDPTVFFPRTGEWFMRMSSGARVRRQYGAPGMVPMAVNVGGASGAELIVYDRATAQWFVLFNDGWLMNWPWGAEKALPFLVHYPHAGLTTFAYTDGETGNWSMQRGAEGLMADRTTAPGALPADLQLFINRRCGLLR